MNVPYNLYLYYSELYSANDQYAAKRQEYLDSENLRIARLRRKQAEIEKAREERGIKLTAKGKRKSKKHKR